MWPASCDIDVTIERMREAFALQFRAGIDARIGVAPEGGFPVDAVLLADARMAFVPHGSGGAAAAWLRAREATEISRRLTALVPAPITGLLFPHGFVEPGASSPQFEALEIRVDPGGVAIGASLRDPDGRTEP